MHDKRMRIYLDDHLALIVGEIELAARCRRSNEGGLLEALLRRLESDLAAQRQMIREVLPVIAGSEGIESMVKRGAAWFAEKLGRFKLNDSLLEYSSLSRVVELETLAAAAQERIALWDSLATIAKTEPRLDRFSFEPLREQSQAHLADLDTQRRLAAVEAFCQS
jgi:hypothetical protein